MDIQITCGCDIKSINNAMNVANGDQQAISILSTVLERCKKERDNNCLQVPLEDYLERVSYYTAYPKMYIYYMVCGNEVQKQEFDIYDHIFLMECINIMYSERKLPQYNNLYEELIKFESRRSQNYKLTCVLNSEALKKKLHAWGYAYKKTLNGSYMLIENPKIKFDRFNYLNKIRNYRLKGRKIYYVDERYILKHSVQKYSSILNDNTQKSYKGFLYLHVISSDGYENGIYVCHDQETSFEETFKKWMIDVILYSIKPSSVVVMQDNVLHGIETKKSITMYHTKKEMLNWLRQNNIPCDSSMRKPTLYELIEKCTTNNKDYDIDRVFKSHGHDVLRLPKTFPLLTPTTYLWSYIAKNFDLSKGNSPVAVKTLLTKGINSLTKLIWATFVDKVESLEKDIYEIDEIAENLTEDLIA
ncbi:unnamed protein product [Euphydryas editha]|uniref:Transposase n=1 Tax=Euphydryas editha TaxID=104508 RepID=A0AAU9THT5_EUPED|nr:unnamed protein product [Euphydryas editha]